MDSKPFKGSLMHLHKWINIILLNYNLIEVKVADKKTGIKDAKFQLHFILIYIIQHSQSYVAVIIIRNDISCLCEGRIKIGKAIAYTIPLFFN
jgi:hypothetical protein